MRTAKELAGKHTSELGAVDGRIRVEKQAFGEIEVAAERMGDIRVGCAKRHDRLNVVDDGAPRSAEGDWNAQGPEPCLFEPTKGLKRQLALEIALRRFSGNFGRKLRHLGEQCGKVGCNRCGPGDW
ncbi:hypothetical protein ACVIEM_006624 [Rhizobium leguminosarum]